MHLCWMAKVKQSDNVWERLEMILSNRSEMRNDLTLAPPLVTEHISLSWQNKVQYYNLFLLPFREQATHAVYITKYSTLFKKSTEHWFGDLQHNSGKVLLKIKALSLLTLWRQISWLCCLSDSLCYSYIWEEPGAFLLLHTSPPGGCQGHRCYTRNPCQSHHQTPRTVAVP